MGSAPSRKAVKVYLSGGIAKPPLAAGNEGSPTSEKPYVTSGRIFLASATIPAAVQKPKCEVALTTANKNTAAAPTAILRAASPQKKHSRPRPAPIDMAETEQVEAETEVRFPCDSCGLPRRLTKVSSRELCAACWLSSGSPPPEAADTSSRSRRASTGGLRTPSESTGGHSEPAEAAPRRRRASTGGQPPLEASGTVQKHRRASSGGFSTRLPATEVASKQRRASVGGVSLPSGPADSSPRSSSTGGFSETSAPAEVTRKPRRKSTGGFGTPSEPVASGNSQPSGPAASSPRSSSTGGFSEPSAYAELARKPRRKSTGGFSTSSDLADRRASHGGISLPSGLADSSPRSSSTGGFSEVSAPAAVARKLRRKSTGGFGIPSELADAIQKQRRASTGGFGTPPEPEEIPPRLGCTSTGSGSLGPLVQSASEPSMLARRGSGPTGTPGGTFGLERSSPKDLASSAALSASALCTSSESAMLTQERSRPSSAPLPRGHGHVAAVAALKEELPRRPSSASNAMAVHRVVNHIPDYMSLQASVAFNMESWSASRASMARKLEGSLTELPPKAPVTPSAAEKRAARREQSRTLSENRPRSNMMRRRYTLS